MLFLLLAQWFNCLLCCWEIAEIQSYQHDIDSYLQDWPACRIYSPKEIGKVSKFVKGDLKEEILQHMRNMNDLLEAYSKFKVKCAQGINLAEKIKSSDDIQQLVEEFDAFEYSSDSYSSEEILNMQLKYAGVFLASSRIMSAFSGDRTHGVPYYLAVTEPVYKYLKKIKEEIEYVAGRLGRFEYNMLKLESSCLIL